ncbi:hypothetical protein DAMA08_027680 [Martiniozyma asiatica (nom. inval.)]|nr:hypothetical protein DAMA08_027680 [Martiniozyma asiatica]
MSHYKSENPFADNYELSSKPQDFFGTLSQLQSSLGQYETALDRLSQTQHNSLNNLERTGGSDDVKNLSLQIRELTSTIKQQVSTLESNVQRSDPDQVNQYNNAIGRFRRLVMKESQIDASYQQQLREKGIEEYQILKPDATYEEALDAVDQFGGNVLQNSVLVEKSQANAEMQARIGEASTVLSEVQYRHQEMLKISEQVLQLNILLEEMHEMMVEQDQIFDSAQYNYEQAQHQQERGAANVIKARDHAKKGRKWKWILLCCVIFLILIIVGLVVGLVKGLK